jgi:hypothetical protein
MRKPGDETGRREQPQASDEHPPAAVQVAGSAAEHQQAAEADREAREHPLQRRVTHVEVGPHRG